MLLLKMWLVEGGGGGFFRFVSSRYSFVLHSHV